MLIQRLLLGVRRTSLRVSLMSAFDPERTLSDQSPFNFALQRLAAEAPWENDDLFVGCTFRSGAYPFKGEP